MLWAEVCSPNSVCGVSVPGPQDAAARGEAVLTEVMGSDEAMWVGPAPTGHRHAQGTTQRGHRETAVYTQERGLGRSQPCRHLDLGRPAPRT